MSNIKDLTGFIFGRLKVISISDERVNRNVCWICECECGNIIETSARNLVEGGTKSCGCYRREVLKNRKGTSWINPDKLEKRKNRKSQSLIDLTNKKFGKLKVISIGKKEKIGKNNYRFWICECECGKIVEIAGTNLRNEKTTHCGCMSTKNPKIKEGMVFGKLKILSLDRIENKKTKNGWVQKINWWLCECECGNFHITIETSLNSGQCKSCGCLSESWIATQLKDYFIKNYNGIAEYRIFKNPETGYFLPFDIYLPNYKIFVEINGKQHYDYVDYWHKDQEGFEYSKQKDEMKKKFAKKNGIYIEIDLRKVKTVEKAIEKIERRIEKLKL